MFRERERTVRYDSKNRTHAFIGPLEPFLKKNRTGFIFGPLDLGSNGHCVSGLFVILLYFSFILFCPVRAALSSYHAPSLSVPLDLDLVAMIGFPVIRSEPADQSDGPDLIWT